MRLRWVHAQLLLMLVPAHAFGQSDPALSEAYQNAAEGLSAFDQGNNERAYAKFSQAYAQVPLPSLAVFAARAQVKRGKFLAAAELYAQAAQLADGPGDHEVQQKAREEAVVERSALLVQIPKLVVATPGINLAEVVFRLDDQPVTAGDLGAGVQLDPGPHKITALFAGQALAQVPLLSAGKATQVTFVFHAAPTKTPAAPHQPLEPAPSGNAMRTAGWVTLGVGGLSLTAAGAGALWALSIKNNLKATGCWNSDECDSAAGDRYNIVRRLSTIAFYTGTVGVATGALFLLVAPKHQNELKPGAQLTPWVSTDSVGVTGLF